MYGITFCGQHTSDLDVLWQTQSRPILPAPKLFLESAPSVDGSFDLSTFNPDGRMHYEDRLHEGIITIIGADLPGMQSKLSKVAQWLQGDYCDLVYDDMPNTVWAARVENVSIAMYELQKVGKATVVFRTRPFSTKRQVWLNDDIELDDESIYLGDKFAPITMLEGAYGYYESIDNDGHFYSRPSFMLQSWNSGSLRIALERPGELDRIFTLTYTRFGEDTPVAPLIISVDFNSLSIAVDNPTFDSFTSNFNFFELPPGPFRLVFDCSDDLTDNNAGPLYFTPNLQYFYEVPND